MHRDRSGKAVIGDPNDGDADRRGDDGKEQGAEHGVDAETGRAWTHRTVQTTAEKTGDHPEAIALGGLFCLP